MQTPARSDKSSRNAVPYLLPLARLHQESAPASAPALLHVRARLASPLQPPLLWLRAKVTLLARVRTGGRVPNRLLATMIFLGQRQYPYLFLVLEPDT